jgi:hypothetical protein
MDFIGIAGKVDFRSADCAWLAAVLPRSRFTVHFSLPSKSYKLSPR